MLPNRLRDLIFVLFGYFDECVQFAEMDAWLYRILDCSNPSLQLFFFRALQTL
jgi:hypothetical protein